MVGSAVVACLAAVSKCAKCHLTSCGIPENSGPSTKQVGVRWISAACPVCVFVQLFQPHALLLLSQGEDPYQKYSCVQLRGKGSSGAKG
jgi:hypothetical protein